MMVVDSVKNITIKIGDLFKDTNDYYLAQCISADFGMGKGIAVQFNFYLDMKNRLMSKYGKEYLNHWRKNKLIADCLLEGSVFNLVTKERYYGKPTYESISKSINLMKRLALANNIKKIAMPRIGCGLDGLDFEKVYEIIKCEFIDTDIEILICII